MRQSSEKEHHPPGVEAPTLLKMMILPKAACRFNGIPMKIPMAFFFFFLQSQTEQLILKFVWKTQRPQRAKAIEKKQSPIALPDFKLYHKAKQSKSLVLA